MQRRFRQRNPIHTQGKKHSCPAAPQVQGDRKDRHRKSDTFRQVLCLRSGGYRHKGNTG